MLATLAYVLPFYISKTTRPSASLSRDAPSVIRSRVRAVTLACIASTFFVVALASLQGDISLPETLKMLGWWPIGFLEIVQSLLLTAVLFSGPLFERGIAEGDWRSWVRGEGLSETLRSWIGFRNFVAVCFIITFKKNNKLIIITRDQSQRKSPSAPSSSLSTYWPKCPPDASSSSRLCTLALPMSTTFTSSASPIRTPQ